MKQRELVKTALKAAVFLLRVEGGCLEASKTGFCWKARRARRQSCIFRTILPRPYRDSRQDMGKSFLNVSNALVLLLAAIVIAHSPEEKLATRHDSQNHRILGKLNEELIIKLVALSQLCSRKVSF